MLFKGILNIVTTSYFTVCYS